MIYTERVRGVLNKKLRLLCAITMLWGCMTTGLAKNYDDKADTCRIVTNSFWDNWFLQVGADMTLLFPVKDADVVSRNGMEHHHHAVKDVFPNGKSFGLSVAAGKWFTPVFGAKLKVNWNNFIKDNYNVWYHPYGETNGSQHNGGFLNIAGDIMFNLHNLFGEYKPDRKWNLCVGPRAGTWLLVREGKGGPILGVGVYNTYRINDKWKLFGDINYSFVSSLNDVDSGTDHGGNSFVQVNVGVEMSLSKNNSFHRASKYAKHYDKATVLNPFWDNWFIQAGVGMSLQNVYGKDFTNVFPRGNTLGINFGFGKWFSPEMGLRLGANWQNSIIRNKNAYYLSAMDDPEGNNLDKRGFASIYGDLFFNLHNLFAGYDKNRKWNAIVFPRMGIGTNFSSSYSECPIAGIGTEQTFAINNKLKLYADFTYQVTTSGFHDKKYKTPDNGMSCNGWFDFNVGIQYDFGKNWWEKPGEKRTTAKLEGGHNWPRFLFNTGASAVVAFGGKTLLKGIIKEERPDHSDNKSFPSGHAAIAFAAARSIDKEFRRDNIWIPIAGYAAATAVGIERIASKRHYWYDVAAGAAVGLGAAELTWWLSDKMFGKGSNLAVGSSGNTVDVTYNF